MQAFLFRLGHGAFFPSFSALYRPSAIKGVKEPFLAFKVGLETFEDNPSMQEMFLIDSSHKEM